MKIIRYWITLCFLGVLFSFEAYGQHSITAALTVRCLNSDGVILTEPLKSAPDPDSSRLSIGAGEEKQLVFHFSEPGTYRYRVLEEENSRGNSVCDDTVYYVTFHVYTTEEGKLYSKTTVSAGKSVSKSGSVTFQNVPRESRTREETETGRRKKKSGGDSPGTKSSGKKRLVKTGDSFHWSLWAGLFMISAAVMALLLKNSRTIYRTDKGEEVGNDD